MVKKTQKPAAKAQSAHLAGTVKESAQQIWLAGLGAFSKAQEEGNKVFETLVKEGVSIQRKTQAVAEERISEATNKMTTMANGITSKATGQWDKLENIFEDRVAKALNKLGVPSAKDVDALIVRIDELNKNVAKLSAKTAATARTKATAAVEAVEVATRKPRAAVKRAAAPRKSAAKTAATASAE